MSEEPVVLPTWDWDWTDRESGLAPIHHLLQRINLLEDHIAYTKRWPFMDHHPSRTEALKRIERYRDAIKAWGMCRTAKAAEELLDEMGA